MVLSRCERVGALLPDDGAFRMAYAALPDWRRRKVEELRFPADRRRSVAAWLLLRRLLSERGVDADTLPVVESAMGKPAFVSAPNIHFSISHGGGRVMAAIADAEVGCDVERLAPVDDGLADAVLVPAEREALATLAGPARDRAFLRLWVRKESYVKAVGTGLGGGLSTFSALHAPPSSGWSWQDFDFGDGHLGCVCASPAASAEDMV